MATRRTASSSGYHWRYLASHRSLFVRVDRCACPYTLDRAHHLFSSIRLRDGPRLPQLLQLPHRLLSPSCRIRSRSQLCPSIIIRCRLPSLCIANVPKPRSQLGLYTHRIFGPCLCASTTVSRTVHRHSDRANGTASFTSRVDRFDDSQSTVEKPMTLDR